MTDMYQRILVPFDGSKFSKRALDEAVKIAQAGNGTIYLCMVVTVEAVVPPGTLLGLVRSSAKGKLRARLIKSGKAESEKLLSSQIDYCKKKGVNSFYKVITNGNVAEEILKVAKKKKADLVVIGSQGLHGISRIKSLGSVSRKVSELADCPVLIVR